MRFDAQLKRYFPLIVCVMLLAVARFQAQGLAWVVRAQIVGEVPALARKLTLARPAPPAAEAPVPDARTVLARNAFDSRPELRASSQLAPGPAASAADLNANPFRDPSCDFGWVVLIAVVEPPSRSIAVVRDKAGQSEVCRVGDRVGTHKVRYIAPERIWLQSSTSRCQMRLGEAHRSAAIPTPPPRRAPGSPFANPRREPSPARSR
jgi:general secretion pathway protein C